MIRLERHAHGPRVFVLGRRVHEWQLGVATGTGALAAALLGPGPPWLWPVAAAAAVWLVVKDWRDVVPSLRDTGSWRVGVHRRFAPLRTARRADGLPSIAAAAALAVGIVSLSSALTPNVAWRHHLLLQLVGVRAVPALHTLAVPLSVVLIVTAWSLRLRRRRAWAVALATLVALTVVHLLKGLDVEEAVLAAAAATLLWWGRSAFYVRGVPLSLRSPVAVALGAVAAVIALTAVAGWIAAGRVDEPIPVLRQTVDLLSWTSDSSRFRDEMGAVPILVALATIASVGASFWLVFRPLAVPAELPDAAQRDAAVALVRAHGSDTLAFFKLRRDAHYLFTPARDAFLAYRVENAVLLVSGDPVGPPEALPALLRETFGFAELRGLRVGVLGASEQLVPLWADGGLSSLYIGDEAIVETAAFSLDGRAIRKVRQAVSRVEREGYRAESRRLEELDGATLGELEHVSELWRAGAPERGFTMAMDSIGGTHQAGSVIVVARDADGRVRGFLHFVPTYGRGAMSLSYMRRDLNTPNGLTEFLLVNAILLLRERGIGELSLNFAMFARWLERPAGRIEHALGQAISLGNPYFQIESLLHFNTKFGPRWEPRYLLFEGALGLPRVGLAAMRIEGQLPAVPRPRRRRSGARVGRQTRRTPESSS